MTEDVFLGLGGKIEKAERFGFDPGGGNSLVARLGRSHHGRRQSQVGLESWLAGEKVRRKTTR